MSALILLSLFLGTSISYGADITCGETSECAGQTLSFDDVFCSGTLSCNHTSITASDDIHCDGFKSCLGESELFAGDDVFCNGGESCNDVLQIRAQNLYCRGPESCNEGVGNRGVITRNTECSCYRSCALAQQIFAQEDVICSGPRSCIGGTFTATDITCDGSYSCSQGETNGFPFSSQVSASNDIYCRGWFGCDGADLSGEDIRCESGWSCRDTEVFVGDEISCHGRFSCLNADISGGSDRKIECFGQNSCETATIKAIPEIKAFGFNSIKNAIIYNRRGPPFNTGISQTMKVEVKGHQAGDGASIYCYDNGINENDCEIECQGNGCNGLTVFCQTDTGSATCVIDCTDADCPTTLTF